MRYVIFTAVYQVKNPGMGAGTESSQTMVPSASLPASQLWEGYSGSSAELVQHIEWVMETHVRSVIEICHSRSGPHQLETVWLH